MFIDLPVFIISLCLFLAGGFLTGLLTQGRLMRPTLRKACDKLGYSYFQLEQMMKEISENG